MANEYLKRTPTSSGNRSIHTWSGWIKRNVLGDWTRLFSTAGQTLLQLTGSSPPDQIRYLDQTGSNYDLRSTSLLRDVGSWMHIVLSVDHTLSVPRDRVRIYVNGAELDDYSTDSTSNGAQNLQTYFNSITEHALLGRETANTGENFKGEAFDVFWVDGQALTPDVFGFYKDGDGYMSSGTTQATDFKPGQWSPRLPKSIKYTINRSGGFGVNGFYLPMNDSSNPGADFHCAPNSIIKLKGEDLPQPRNGAPTTSDAFVSELRDDPFSANLVLAIPGINTPPTGSELITNGTFDTDVSSWTAQPSNSLTHQPDGTAKATRGGGAEVATQVITTVVGQTYELSVDVTEVEGSHGQVYVNSSGDLNTNIGYSFSCGSFKGTFTADTTSTNISLYAHPAGPTSYDNVSVKATTIQDYSADIKGSGSNHTLVINNDCGVRSVYQSNNPASHYGSAISFEDTGDNITMSGSSDFNFGTGDFTIEAWVKPRTLSGTHQIISCAVNSENWQLMRHSSGVLRWNSKGTNDGSTSAYNSTVDIPLNQWSHVAVCLDGTQLSLYMNGVCVATFAGYTSNLDFNGSPCWGAWDDNKDLENWRGCMTDMRIYKGVAKYKGGFDVPNPYYPVGIEEFRTTADTCKNNFMTMSPLSVKNSSSGGFDLSLSDGNLTVAITTGNSNESARGSFIVSSGKWYFETTLPNANGLSSQASGVGVVAPNIGGVDGSSGSGYAIIYRETGGAFLGNGDSRSDPAAGTYPTYVAGDIIGVALDIDNEDVEFFKNGVSAATFNFPAHAVSGTNWTIESLARQSDSIINHNFGQNPSFSGTKIAGTNADDSGKGLFKYAPPSGFLALCEDNLPTPAIADPGEHFKCVLYSGDNSAGRRISDVGFQPDLVWVKARNASPSHILTDSVRGIGHQLSPDDDGVEVDSGTFYLTSFADNGFDLGDGANSGGNTTGRNYVAWCWKAGGAAVSNTDGIASNVKVSANQTAGISIITYDGNGINNSVGHGLGKSPAMIIIKNRDTSLGDAWRVWHQSLATNGRLILSEPKTEGSAPTLWQNTLPSDTVFYLDSDVRYNTSGDNNLAIVFAEIEGFSKFGSYVGNGNTSEDGPFVYCGFKPAWIMMKNADASGSWVIMDNARVPSNPNDNHLLSNSANPQSVSNMRVDFVSNGFKITNITTNYTDINGDGNKIIFAAFAESPFQTANAK